MKPIVISLGGSRIVPDKVDYKFLKKFKKLIQKHKNKKIVICCGGGSTARTYIQPLIKEKIQRKKVDKVGIATTRLNAKLVTAFLKISNPSIPITLQEVKTLLKKYNIVVCGGLKPGMTSDGTTAQIAQYLKAESLINLTNVKGLYTKDPKKFKKAKFIPKITYKDFQKFIDKLPNKPGQHFILDSLATKIVRKAKIKTIILGNLRNLNKYLSNKKFTGTTIMS